MLHYTNVFDAMIDAAYFAMADLNFTNIPVVVSETGWLKKGDQSEPAATNDNGDTYNNNLVRHVVNNTGTPKHPGNVLMFCLLSNKIQHLYKLVDTFHHYLYLVFSIISMLPLPFNYCSKSFGHLKSL